MIIPRGGGEFGRRFSGFAIGRIRDENAWEKTARQAERKTKMAEIVLYLSA